MDDPDTKRCRWENLHIDILVKIFQLLDIFELTSGIAHVCSAWRMACCDPIHWKTLDLSMFKSNFIKIYIQPFVIVDRRPDKTLTRFLKLSLSLSKESITTLIFHYDLYVTDEQLTYTAEMCPHLKQLVMPAWHIITKAGMCKAIPGWKELESLTMRSNISNPQYLLEEIAANCKNFSELKIRGPGPCDIFFASSLAAFVPNLRVLSLRCSMLYRDVLILILDSLQQLEVLNISHCILVEPLPPPQYIKVINEIDSTIRQK